MDLIELSQFGITHDDDGDHPPFKSGVVSGEDWGFFARMGHSDFAQARFDIPAPALMAFMATDAPRISIDEWPFPDWDLFLHEPVTQGSLNVRRFAFRSKYGRSIMVADVEQHGSRTLLPIGHWDGNELWVTFTQGMEDAHIRTIEGGEAGLRASTTNDVAILSSIAALLMVVANTLMSNVVAFLQSEPELVEQARRKAQQRQTRKPKKGKKRSPPITVIGKRIKFTKPSQQVRQGSKWTVRTLVRGHWRNQPCGPGGESRKRIWIRPHYKGDPKDPMSKRHYRLEV